VNNVWLRATARRGTSFQTKDQSALASAERCFGRYDADAKFQAIVLRNLRK
jgi:hypothetical protein